MKAKPNYSTKASSNGGSNGSWTPNGILFFSFIFMFAFFFSANSPTSLYNRLHTPLSCLPLIVDTFQVVIEARMEKRRKAARKEIFISDQKKERER